MAINQNVMIVLDALSDEYKKSRDNESLSLSWVNDIKTLYKQSLLARMAALEAEGFINMDEMFEIETMLRILNNGWTPTDMTLFINFYDMIEGMPHGPARIAGENLVQELIVTDCKDLATRMALLNKCAGYLIALGPDPERAKINSLMNEVLGTNITYSEYPEDAALQNYYQRIDKFDSNRTVNRGKPVQDFTALYEMALRHNNAPEELKDSIRKKEDYVLSARTKEKLEAFRQNEGQRHNSITKSNRDAIKEIYGEGVYDEIDEMRMGTEKERTIKIYHSMGNKWMREGEDVLEIDFAGSGYREIRKEYHGQHGKVFSDGTRSPEKTLEAEFGTLVDKPNNKGKYSHLRSKTVPVTIDGKTKYKTRYTIAGPTPDLWLKPGLLNWGEYSIENTRVYGKNFAADFLTKAFARWDKGEELPHDLHINLTGHSRGAVSAGESVKLMNKWLQEYAQNNPTKAHYIDKVKFDVVLRDPVPGFITKLFHRKNDLRKVPNLNTTVFCSMAQEHADMIFPLQNVRGAKRLIIGTTGHNMDLGQMDMSQTNQPQDGKVHKVGFYDAETGELFRGSGMNQMPDGVYIADDKLNLIRITSYSQIGKLIDSVYDGKWQQSGRTENIHDMVRNWFVDNDLKMSFVDEDARSKANEDNNSNMDKILKSRNKRLDPVKDAILALNISRTLGKDNEDVLQRENELIKACKAYLQKTSIPAKGDSLYRVNLVSDVLSHTMRDRNYINRKLHPELNPEGAELDERIRAHKNRLENKEGYLERKLESEEKRLVNETEIQRLINDTAHLCGQYIDILNETRKNKGNSDTYNNFLNTLKDGSKLGNHTSINDFSKFLDDMLNITLQYNSFHDDPILGPLTKDGKTRLDISKSFKGFSIEIGKAFREVSRFTGEKDIAVGKLVQRRSESVHTLNEKVHPELVKLENNQPKKVTENKNVMNK